MGQTKANKRVVIYCRVSTLDQSNERQESDLIAFAERAGYNVVGIFKENASGAKDDRPERKKVLALAQARKIDAVLVTELTRWGRSTLDVLNTLSELESRGVSLIAQTGIQFDRSTPEGKLFATIMAGLAEFERDLIRDRVRSGLAAARAKGVQLGRKEGQIPQRVRELEPKILALKAEGKSHRIIAKELGVSKNTVTEVMKRN